MSGRSSIRGRHRSIRMAVIKEHPTRFRFVVLGRAKDPGKRANFAGSSSRLRITADAGGFTLLEVLVVIALIGLISALLIGSSDALLKSIGKDDIETTALTAIANARHSAVLAGHTEELHNDAQARTLSWDDGSATLTGEGTVRLLPAVKTSAILVGGQAVEGELSRVRFYADGTCDPFRLEVVKEDKTSHQLSIDPWTCTPLSPEAAPIQH